MSRYCLMIVVLLLTGGQVFAQYSQLRFGDRQYELLNFREAADAYEASYAKKASYQTARKAALAYEQLNDYQKTYQWWQAVAGYPEADLEDKKAYALSAQRAEDMQAFEQLKGTLAENGIMLVAMKDKPNQRAKLQPLEELNTSFAEFGITYDSHGNRYFTSDRGLASSKRKAIRIDGSNKFGKDAYGWTGRDFLNVYRMDKDGKVEEVKSPVPNTYHFSDPYFLKQSPHVFYTVTREVKGIRKRDYDIHPELYYSKVNEKGEFEGFTAFPYNAFEQHAIITPFVDEKNQRVYFASDMEGGTGGLDLYYVTYDKDFKFGEPVNLGPQINTEGDERNPFMFKEQLYFSSNGHPGFGGLDIFKASLVDGEVAELSHLGQPYNSPQDDFAFMQKEKNRFYVSSDRQGGKGLDDIYLIEERYVRFLAHLVDCDGNPVEEEFSFALQDNSRRSIQTQMTGKGQYAAELEQDFAYTVNIAKEGYFALVDTTLTAGEEESLERQYTMVKIPYRTPLFVDLIYYDLDRSEIREDAKASLDKLAEMLKAYDFLNLQVKSHTDARASETYNESLSQKRAEAVLKYLQEQGVPEERLVAEWFGKKKPVNNCGDGVHCSETDYQLNRRSELVLQAFPEEGKEYDFPIQFAAADCDQTLLAALQDDLMEKGLLAMPRVYFDFDKYSLRAPHKKELEKLALMMQYRADFSLELAGHTDLRGAVDYNQKLSEKRAKAVFQYLLNRGVEESRLAYQWFGMSNPVNDCRSCTESQHQENRRTEVRFFPTVQRQQLTAAGQD